MLKSLITEDQGTVKVTHRCSRGGGGEGVMIGWIEKLDRVG